MPSPNASENARDNADVSVTAEAVMAALALLGNYVQSSTGASLSATDTQNKTDVNVPEVLTGFNAMTQAAAMRLQAALDRQVISDASQAAFWRDVSNQQALDHRDQMHTLQVLALGPPFAITGDLAEEANDDTDRS